MLWRRGGAARHWVSFTAACATALAACAGSSSSGSNSASVGGQPVPTAVLGASIATSTATATTPSYAHAEIYFVSEGSACLGTPMEIAASPNATYMRFLLEVAGTSIVPGTYAVGGVTEQQADGGIGLGSYLVGDFGV